MKKSIIIGIIILLGVTGIFAVQKSADHANHDHKENKVATTIFPLYDLTKKVAGDEFDVVLILPSGTSPHTFDPQPSLLKELQGSQSIFAIGHGLDNWSNIIAESINAPVVVMDHDLDLRENEEFHDDHVKDEHKDNHNEDIHDHKNHHDHAGHNHDDHDDHDDYEGDAHAGHNHGPIDPHYWLSVHNAEQITLNIAEELADLDPENKDIYLFRAQKHVQELEVLKMELQQKTASLSDKNIISFHDAWYYFAKEFGLSIVGTFEPSAGKEPSPRYMVNLKESVEEHNVSTLFMEPQLSQASIRSFADDHKLNIAVIDPLGGALGRETYVDLMRYNVDQVIKALSN